MKIPMILIYIYVIMMAWIFGKDWIDRKHDEILKIRKKEEEKMKELTLKIRGDILEESNIRRKKKMRESSDARVARFLNTGSL